MTTNSFANKVNIVAIEGNQALLKFCFMHRNREGGFEEVAHNNIIISTEFLSILRDSLSSMINSIEGKGNWQ